MSEAIGHALNEFKRTEPGHADEADAALSELAALRAHQNESEDTMNDKAETKAEATTGVVPVEREVSPTPPPRTVAVLNDGNTAIVVDDHCYAIRNWMGEEWGWSSHIFPEASRVLRSLPVLPDDAERA